MTEGELPENARALWTKSRHAVQLRNYGYAISLIQSVLKQYPDFLEGEIRLREIEALAGNARKSPPPNKGTGPSKLTSETVRAVRAVFLDRDGVINRPVIRDGKPYPPATISEFELLPGVEEACARLKAAGWLLIVATNQPDVGRGTQRQEEVEAMHAAMCAKLPIDRVEVSYDPGQGVPSEFRKPAPGMLLRAARELGIDLGGSWMVGDRWRDVDCGAAAGCRTIFIDYGYDEKLRAKPDFTTDRPNKLRRCCSFGRFPNPIQSKAGVDPEMARPLDLNGPLVVYRMSAVGAKRTLER